jgi:phosphatidylserine/phosphatidylglycerophosphate/cardiolipin synthase-like enzyme
MKHNNHQNNHHGNKGNNHNDYNKKTLDMNFNHQKEYFYQELNVLEIEDIKNFLTLFLTTAQDSVDELTNFFKKHPNLRRGPDNLAKLHKTVDDIYNSSTDSIVLNSYKMLSDFITSTYYVPTPVVQECFFFPGKENEKKVLNFLRKPKKTLDIAIFTLTNDFIFLAVEETFKRGVKVRVISDDECLNQFGSDICRLAMIGIPVKTDNEVKYHMHHKFAIADNSVVFTGSFNWTTQAVFNNQENVLIIENKQIASEYTEEFNRLWNSFTAEVTKEKGKQLYQKQRD